MEQKAGLGGGDCGFELETRKQQPSFMLLRILKAARNLPLSSPFRGSAFLRWWGAPVARLVPSMPL